MKYLFLDTCGLLQFKGFEDIPWKSILNTDDDITIVIASIVMREIDKHKDGPKGKKKNKARDLSKKMNKVFLQGETCRVPLLYCMEKQIEQTDTHKFDLSVNDDRLVATALFSDYPNEDIYVVSYDTNILIKAKDAGLKTLYMPEEFLATEEPSEEEKELKKVKTELDRWTNRLPKPSIGLYDAEDNVLRIKKEEVPDIDILVEDEVNKEAIKVPKEELSQINYNNSYDYLLQLHNSMNRLLHSDLEINTFNSMREEYLKDFRAKRFAEMKHQIQKRTYKRLKFYVQNTGTAPTGDMYVELTFPESLMLYSPNESRETLRYKKPVKPEYWHYPQMPSLALYGVDNTHDSVEVWDVSKYVRNRQSVHIPSLTHGLIRPIKEFDLYVHAVTAGEFDIKWCIADTALIDHQYGNLKLIIE